MAQALAITRTAHTAILHGGRAAGRMDGQTLRDWVHRYNDEGFDGLKSRRSSGRASLLAAAQKDELHALVIAGPDPQFHKVARWRWVDLRAESPGGFQWRCMRLPRAPGCINLA